MNRVSTTLSIDDLQKQFLKIDFPEYQREPDIWSRDQKQRLIDSILRRFDIAAVYLYRRDDGGLDCIDGRQRLNAIMSFLGDNLSDARDNNFPLNLDNEISGGLQTPFDALQGSTFKDLESHAHNPNSEHNKLAHDAIEAIRGYEITTVELSSAEDPEEFNLQFLRLNLGALINAGEKLHAMIGQMRDIIFKSALIGKHPFFDFVRIPTRRYAKELTAAQVLLQVFSIRQTEGFARARHIDLQRFVKEYAQIDLKVEILIGEVSSTLDALQVGAEEAAKYLRNRAITVSLVILAWKNDVRLDAVSAADFWAFSKLFMGRLRWQVDKMSSFSPDREYPHLVEFQRHLTQASVEKPALEGRHQILKSSLEQWLIDGHLVGDAEYQRRTGQAPGIAE